MSQLNNLALNSGMLCRKKVFVSEIQRLFFPLVAICIRPFPDFLVHTEHGWSQNLATSMWIKVCGIQLHIRGSPHCRTSPWVCLGLGKASKLKPCLRVSIFMNVRCTRQLIGCCDISPDANECCIRLTQRTQNYVQLHESGYKTDRFVMGISHGMHFCRQQMLHKGKMLHKTKQALTAFTLLQPESESTRNSLSLALRNKSLKVTFALCCRSLADQDQQPRKETLKEREAETKR